MSSVRKVLRTKSGFQFADVNARIISGEEEGSCGWITVNYLKKILQKKHKVSSQIDLFSIESSHLSCESNNYISYNTSAFLVKEHIEKSSGALDLGGASTQITFVPQNASLATQHFRLYGKDYPVYTKTYLCYGLTEIYRRFLAQLAKVW